jgi:sulfite reductase alpha subunit-like flavoprotein
LGQTGTLIGDPANKEITEYLIEKKLWTPPTKKSAFDVLPMVLKMPGKETPYVHMLPADSLFEVDIEHPKYPAFKDIGLRWTTVPAISTFKMNLGGVVYANMPFNGWFVSTEIVRNLMERYDVGSQVAKLCGIDTQTDPMWRQGASVEVERAVLYSFKKNGYTIVDPHSVGESFCVHVQREREQHGLECPAQWSWIGGLVGPTNKTWHLEMRDFLVQPQYAYCIDGLAYYQSLEHSRMKVVASGSRSLPSIAGDDSSISSSEQDEAAIPKVLILYGSETGTAEGVARQLKRILGQLKPTVVTLNQGKGLHIAEKKGFTHLLCITSTFGKGDFPVNAAEFAKAPIDAVSFSSMKYSVLALGSTMYPDFCKAGVELDMKLEKSGIERLTRFVTKVDESTGAEESIADWLKLVERLVLTPAVVQELERRAMDDGDVAIETVFNWLGRSATVASSRGKGSLCLSNTLLTEAGTKPVRQVTFQIPVGDSYETGDHLSVHPQNSMEFVGRFLACFMVQLEKAFAEAKAIDQVIDEPFELERIEGSMRSAADVVFPMPTTLRVALTEHIDLSMKGAFAVEFVTLCSNLCAGMMDDQRAASFVEDMAPYLALKGDIDEFVSYYPTIVDFFEKYGWLAERVSLAEVLVLLPRLQPRYYSISSSALIESSLTITVGVLAVETSKKAKLKGVCSHYLAGLTPMLDRATVQIRTSSFRLPQNFSSSMVLVGAGTGLAPMMGFLQELEIASEQGICTGNIHLFFGCRTEADYIYKDRIEEYEAAGLLTAHVAFSRSPNHPKMYVQDQIIKAGEQFKDLLLDPTTHYYVCGDAVMAAACQEAAVTTLRNHGMSRITAVQHVQNMRLEDRWQTDVWGIVADYESSKKTLEISKKASAKVWLSHFQQNSE